MLNNLQINDQLISVSNIDRSLRKVYVDRVNKRFAVLSDGAKVSLSPNEDGRYNPVPKNSEGQFRYFKATEELLDRLNKQGKVKTSNWKALAHWAKTFNAETFFQGNSIALIFCTFLLISQAFHSAHALIEMSSALGSGAYLFGIMSALFLDGLILFFLSNGAKWFSGIAMVTCIALNVYSYHLGIEWGTYDSYFSLVPSAAIPYALHGVGTTIIKKRKN